jgi:hypothetical protein
MLLRGWGTWSPLCSAVTAPGGITEILHDWACKVDAAGVTGGLGASASSAPPLSQGAQPVSIFGGSTKEAAITKNGGGTGELPQSLPLKDIE